MTAFPLLVAWGFGGHAFGQQRELSRALLDQYCIACHSDANRTANISLTPLDPANVSAHGDVWEKVLRKVSAGEMPPAGLPRPEKDVSAAFVDSLQAALDDAAAARPDPGRPAIHRLNRSEYANAVRDLLSIEIDEKEALPADDTGYGFDNVADVLSISPIVLERYISAARRISRLAVGATDIVPGQADYRLPLRGVGELINQRVSDDLPFSSQGGMSVDHYFPVDAEYVIKVDLYLADEAEQKSLDLRMQIPAGLHTVGATFPGSGAMEETSAPSGRRRGGGSNERTAMVDIRLDGERLSLAEFQPRGETPRVAAIFIDGPYDITGPGDTPSRRAIFTCTPAAGEEDDCARSILSRLAHRAYRRPLTDDDVSPLVGIYQAVAREQGFETGIQRALQAILVSPKFLFRIERDPENATRADMRRVTDLELASRLSFFLWSSIPDEELLSLAEQGRLHEPEVLRAQVRRMIADPKSDALIENFAGQWLFLRKVDTVNPDEKLFPEFDLALRRAAKRETELFFAEVLRDNRSVLDLLDADFTYLNEQLAAHYGIDGVYGSQFRRVAVKDPNRRGLLGQTSILTVTSYPNRTSVVQRGAWVLENLLGTPPPPPPPNVPELEAESEGRKLSLREAMEAHRANPVCAGCHARMDPIGFALENFDAIGRWRDEDQGGPIDASGTLPDGTAFDGPRGLNELMTHQFKEAFASTAVEKLMIYSLGRGLESYDRPVIRSILRATRENGYQMGDLITHVVESTPFQMRRITER